MVIGGAEAIGKERRVRLANVPAERVLLAHSHRCEVAEGELRLGGEGHVGRVGLASGAVTEKHGDKDRFFDRGHQATEKGKQDIHL